MLTRYFEINTRQDKIWCAYDCAAANGHDGPLVIVAPGFEKTARDSLSIAFYLTMNGFRVLRFDARNCCGLSSGDIRDFTLSGLTEDIAAVAEYAAYELSNSRPISMLAFSLSARSMLRYLAASGGAGGKIGAAVSIVGVVDVAHTVTQITGENCFEGFLNGKRYGVRKLLTYGIDYDNFITDTINNNFLSCESSADDARGISIPYYGSIMTGDDEWILKEHQKTVHSVFTKSRVEQFVIQGATHKIWKNPRSADIAVRNCVRILSGFMLGREIPADMVKKPDITRIIEKNREERKVIYEWSGKKPDMETANAN